VDIKKSSMIRGEKVQAPEIYINIFPKRCTDYTPFSSICKRSGEQITEVLGMLGMNLLPNEFGF
jgi:hypothetical protein